MESKIASLLKLHNYPVAVYRTNKCPENAVQFKEGKWGCIVAMLNASANKGITATFCDKTVTCKGGRAGIGIEPFKTGIIEYHLSVGGKGPKAGEFYRRSPELALDYIESMPEYRTDNYLVFTPLCNVDSELKENLDGIIFLVNADQLSGLVTLSNFDRKSLDNTAVTFGSGCAQSVLFPFSAENTNQKCYIGLTDPSARKCISGETLSFSIPWARFKEMELVAEESFLTKETWGVISRRL
ncbi:MAG: DUF169 domain-containing protein [Eubacteriales bacterium]|nr:DUF169 domain-containing protein [Eubacteriales bacterium]